MLFLAAAALLMPAIFELVEGKGLPRPGAEIVDYGGDGRAPLAGRRVVLIVTYVAGLFFSLQDPPRRLQPAVRGRRTPGAGACAPR